MQGVESELNNEMSDRIKRIEKLGDLIIEALNKSLEKEHSKEKDVNGV